MGNVGGAFSTAWGTAYNGFQRDLAGPITYWATRPAAQEHGRHRGLRCLEHHLRELPARSGRPGDGLVHPEPSARHQPGRHCLLHCLGDGLERVQPGSDRPDSRGSSPRPSRGCSPAQAPNGAALPAACGPISSRLSVTPLNSLFTKTIQNWLMATAGTGTARGPPPGRILPQPSSPRSTPSSPRQSPAGSAGPALPGKICGTQAWAHFYSAIIAPLNTLFTKTIQNWLDG